MYNNKINNNELIKFARNLTGLETEELETPFGIANVNSNGYYVITRGNSEYFGKLLHRLFYEAMVGPIPPNHVIHHLNGVKTDNRISNLKCVTKQYHGVIHNNSTGFLYVVKEIDTAKSQGFRYRYEAIIDGKRTRDSAVDLATLRKRVTNKGYPWEITDKAKAFGTIIFEFNKFKNTYNKKHDELINLLINDINIGVF